MTNEEATNVLGDVRAYLSSRASLENEILAGHTFIDICNAIKALEQQPCEDCVSRQTIDQNIYDYAESNGLSYANMKNYIFDTPSVTPTQRWIPCSERLPQLKEQVLFCEKDKVLIGYMVFEYDGDFVFTTPYCKYYYVTAWMPFPEPYRAEMESEE